MYVVIATICLVIAFFSCAIGVASFFKGAKTEIIEKVEERLEENLLGHYIFTTLMIVSAVAVTASSCCLLVIFKIDTPENSFILLVVNAILVIGLIFIISLDRPISRSLYYKKLHGTGSK